MNHRCIGAKWFQVQEPTQEIPTCAYQHNTFRVHTSIPTCAYTCWPEIGLGGEEPTREVSGPILWGVREQVH
jgi:hypothetical protein